MSRRQYQQRQTRRDEQPMFPNAPHILGQVHELGAISDSLRFLSQNLRKQSYATWVETVQPLIRKMADISVRLEKDVQELAEDVSQQQPRERERISQTA